MIHGAGQAMDVRLILVPYDSARRGWRMGAGPEHLRARGLGEALRQRLDARVTSETIEAPSEPSPAEIRTTFELVGRLSGPVAAATARGELPLVLTANCIASAGVLAGPGGVSPADLLQAIAAVGRAGPILAVTLSAYDPAADPRGRIAELIFEVAAAAVAAARP